MRLFISINFNPETRTQLIDLRETLRAQSTRGNFSRDDNLHLTLAFIGECSPQEADTIKASLETVTFSPFELTIERLGTFSRGKLWWAGVRPVKPLMNLQREIVTSLIRCGFEMEKRTYTPHITFGREVVTAVKPWGIEPFGERVNAIHLMKSERVEGELTYTSIFGREGVD